MAGSFLSSIYAGSKKEPQKQQLRFSLIRCQRDSSATAASIVAVNESSRNFTCSSSASSSSAIDQLHKNAKSSDSSCTKAKIDSQLKSYFLLACYALIGFLTGSFFYAWPATQMLYMRCGVYDWLCSSSSSSSITTTSVSISISSSNSVTEGPSFSGSNVERYCDSRLSAVNSLMPTGVASMFVFSFVGGLLVDYIGPKFTAMFGLISQIIGWILFLLCNEKFQFYSLANILMGFGSDPVLFSLLDISAHFRSSEGLIIGIISASRSFSFIIPPILNSILDANPTRKSVETAVISYIGVLVACFAAVAFILPWRGFEVTNKKLSEQERQQQLQQARERELERLAAPMMHWGKTKASGSLYPFSIGGAAGVATTDSSFVSDATTARSTYSVSQKFRPSRVIPIEEGAAADLSQLSILTADNFSRVSSKHMPQQSMSTQSSAVSTLSSLSSSRKHDEDFTYGSNFIERISSKPNSIQSIINSIQFLVLFPIAAISVLCVTFFVNSSQSQLSDSITSFSVFLTPVLAAAAGAVLGQISDCYGPVLVLFLLSILNVCQFVLLLVQPYSSFAPYIIPLVSPVVLSFFLTQFYCYVYLSFSPSCSVKSVLCGFIIMSTGLLSLVVTPMCDFSSFTKNYAPMNGLCLALAAFSGVFIYSLYKQQGGLMRKQQQQQECREGKIPSSSETLDSSLRSQRCQKEVAVVRMV